MWGSSVKALLETIRSCTGDTVHTLKLDQVRFKLRPIYTSVLGLQV